MPVGAIRRLAEPSVFRRLVPVAFVRFDSRNSPRPEVTGCPAGGFTTLTSASFGWKSGTRTTVTSTCWAWVSILQEFAIWFVSRTRWHAPVLLAVRSSVAVPAGARKSGFGAIVLPASRRDMVRIVSGLPLASARVCQYIWKPA